MGKESSRMELGLSKKKKRWEDEINEFLKPGETEEMQGNEIKNNDTWIKVAKNRENGKEMDSEYAITAAAASGDSVHSRRCPPQDPSRPGRYLNCVKLDDYEMVNIVWPLTKDQTDFDWYGLQAFYVVPRLRANTCDPRHTLQCSSSLKGVKPSRADERKPQDVRVCHTFPRPRSLLSTESENSAVLFQFYTALSSLIQSTKSLPCLQSKVYRLNRFFFVWGHDPSTYVRRVRFLTSRW